MESLANRVEVAELRMLRWTCGKTLRDIIPNEVYRAQLEVETIINKMREGRLRWFGHVRRRSQSAPVRRVKDLVVDGMRRRGRPKLKWEDRVKQDMKELLLSEDMTSDRIAWRAIISAFMLCVVAFVSLVFLAPLGFCLFRCLCVFMICLFGLLVCLSFGMPALSSIASSRVVSLLCVFVLCDVSCLIFRSS
ncbi:hypothetical protein Tco_0632913 [Tanacetum coccineum]